MLKWPTALHDFIIGYVFYKAWCLKYHALFIHKPCNLYAIYTLQNIRQAVFSARPTQY